MPITNSDIEKSKEVLLRYGVRRILLFGSSSESPEKARDLDLAVEGLDPKDYLKALGELLDTLPVSVDLVDLSDDTRFSRMIRRRGSVVYEC